MQAKLEEKSNKLANIKEEKRIGGIECSPFISPNGRAAVARQTKVGSSIPQGDEKLRILVDRVALEEVTNRRDEPRKTESLSHTLDHARFWSTSRLSPRESPESNAAIESRPTKIQTITIEGLRIKLMRHSMVV